MGFSGIPRETLDHITGHGGAWAYSDPEAEPLISIDIDADIAGYHQLQQPSPERAQRITVSGKKRIT